MSAGRFVILAAPRTGSNLLCTLLNSHPDILCHHEVFNPRGVFYAIDHRDGSIDLGSVAERDRAPHEFLDRVWHETRGARHTGFKMTKGQNEDVMRRVTESESVQKIIVTRANRVRTYVSQLIAEHTDQWEVYDEDRLARDVPRLFIDASALRSHAQSNAVFYAGLRATLRSTRQKWLEVRYGDLLLRDTHERLLAYLGAAPAPLAAASVRQNCRSLDTLIENYHELETALHDSAYDADLHEREEIAGGN